VKRRATSDERRATSDELERRATSDELERRAGAASGERRTPLVALLGLLVLPGTAIAQIAVKAETVHTMAGPPITDGVVLVGRDGKIERVGLASEIGIPAGYRTLTAKIVTPGLVDAHSVVGLSGALNQPHDQMQLELSTAMQPELRAIDAYNARETLVEWLRIHGVTTVHTGHAPGALISGQTMIVKTVGNEVEDATIVPVAAIACTLGADGLAEHGKSPGTRSKAIAMLREELLKAKDYVVKLDGPEDKRPARDLRLEALGKVITRDLPLMVTAQRVVDIMDALRVAREFDIRIILDGAAESYLVLDQIKAAKVPVIVHPTMFRAGQETENLSMETPATLKKAGILVALQSGYETYVPKTRVVLFEAAEAAANGLSFEEALSMVTIDAARILGIDKRVGSLEPGKDGDLALFDGDPFEFTSHVIGVVINGQAVSQEVE
jgi:imidazolonepropionase-like amidohydrolase